MMQKMAAPKLFRKTNGDHYQYLYAVYEGDKVTWLTLIDQADLLDARKNTLEEFEEMIFNENWNEDINTPCIVNGQRVEIKRNQ